MNLKEADAAISIHRLIGEVVVILITGSICEVENGGRSVNVVDEKLDLANFWCSGAPVSTCHSFIVCSICEHQGSVDPIHGRCRVEWVVIAGPGHFEPVGKAVIVDISGLGGSKMGELVKGPAFRSGGVSDGYPAGITSHDGYGASVTHF